MGLILYLLAPLVLASVPVLAGVNLNAVGCILHVQITVHHAPPCLARTALLVISSHPSCKVISVSESVGYLA